MAMTSWSKPQSFQGWTTAQRFRLPALTGKVITPVAVLAESVVVWRLVDLRLKILDLGDKE